MTKVSEAGVDKAIGTGPYKLTSYDNARGYTLTANPAYAMGKPKVDTVKVVVIPDESTQFAALRTGEIQLSTRIVPPQQLAALERQPNIGVVKGTEFASTLLAFNTTRAPFDRPEVRRALAKAINVENLVKTALLGQGTPGDPGFIHAESPVSSGSLPPLFDAGAAGRELDALGAKPGADGVRVLDGKPMAYELLVQSTSTDRLRSAELIRDMFEKVGVAVMEGRVEAAGRLQARIAEQVPFLTLYYRNGAYAFRKDAYDGWAWQNGSAVLNKFSLVDFTIG